jgi:hypothetical protein
VASSERKSYLEDIETVEFWNLWWEKAIEHESIGFYRSGLVEAPLASQVRRAFLGRGEQRFLVAGNYARVRPSGHFLRWGRRLVRTETARAGLVRRDSHGRIARRHPLVKGTR